MKWITKIMPIICTIIVTILSILYIDLSQSRKYMNFEDYKHAFMRVNYDDDNSINENTIQKLVSLAKENNVILLKSNIHDKKGNKKNIYLSLNSMEEIFDFMSKSFEIQKLKNQTVDFSSSSFISTYNHNDKNQVALIRDFLGNDNYNYYTFDNLLEKNGNFYGDYIVYYKNYYDYDSFLNEAKLLVGNDLHSDSAFTNPQKYVFILMTISVVILMLFYFVFQIFDSYYKSKNIGCMKLLGFDKFKISYIMTKKSFMLYFTADLLIIVMSGILVKNVTFSIILLLIFIHFIILLITYIINCYCTKVILGDYYVSNILKKQNVSLKISKISKKMKFITIILLIILNNILFSILISSYSNLKVYNNSKELLDYGIIRNFVADSPDIFNYQKQSELYKNIVKDGRLNTFYSEFSRYVNLPKDEMDLQLEWEQSGKDFRYASVDKNYLIKENFIIYNLEEKEVELSSINEIFFLFPKSRKGEIEKFKLFYEEDSKADYEKYGISHKFQAYIYEDRKVNSYRLDLDIKYVDSPIIRVINEDLTLSYLESPRGVSIFGNNLTTGLKIEVKNNSKQVETILDEIIRKSELENLIGSNNFMTFYDYFNDEIQNSNLVTFSILLSLFIIIAVYIVISFQVITLYIKSEYQKVIVKFLLGYKKNDIFKLMITKHIKNSIVAFTICFIILYILRVLNMLLFLASILLFFMIDYIILCFIIKSYNFKKIYIKLKGGIYD